MRRPRSPIGFARKFCIGVDMGRAAFLHVSCNRIALHIAGVRVTRRQAEWIRDRIDWWLKATENG